MTRPGQAGIDTRPATGLCRAQWTAPPPIPFLRSPAFLPRDPRAAFPI